MIRRPTEPRNPVNDTHPLPSGGPAVDGRELDDSTAGVLRTTAQRDRGAVLPMVLVTAVIGMLIVLPLLDYAITLYKSNTQLVDKTARIEGARAGLRTLLTDPQGLYEQCSSAGTTTPVQLARLDLQVTASSQCFLIGTGVANDPTALRYGNTTTQVGMNVPAELQGTTSPESGAADPTAWQASSSEVPEQDRIWSPNLPVHALDPRAADPFEMPKADPADPTCNVYFPGTYRDPLVIDGLTFFMSGIYYFEDDVVVAQGADAVVGEGYVTGCTTDQDAAFYAIGAPATHNSTGKGATFVLGDSARFLVDDSDGSGDRSIVFNQRYVGSNETSVLSSAGISIMTVNGSITSTDGRLSTGDIDVPMSYVGAGTTTLATDQDYLPSTVSVDERAPGAPTAVVTSGRRGGSMLVSWQQPADEGNTAITGYTVTSNEGETCTTGGWTGCVVTGLDPGNDDGDDSNPDGSKRYTFTVTATNAVGTSPPSAPSSPRQPTGPQITLPTAPTGFAIQNHSDGSVLTWTMPNDGRGVITDYEVVDALTELTVQCSTRGPEATTCDIDHSLLGAAVKVRARNGVGWGPFSSTLLVGQDSSAGPVPVAPTPDLVRSVVDIDLTGTSTTRVVVPGYVATPQGRVSIDNPRGEAVAVTGGFLAARIDVDDSRTGNDLEIGFVNAIVQRVLKIVTTSTDGRATNTATAVVQVNEGGGWAVNSWEVQ